MPKSIHILLLIYLLRLNVTAQKAQLVYERHFVKTGKILIRVVPSSKEVFDMMKSGIMRITRCEENESNMLTIEDNYRTFTIADTAGWMKIFRKDKNKAAFAYQALYKNEANALEKKREKMLHDLLMLSCDFDSDIARACGLFFCDSTAEKEKNYSYKLELYTSRTTFRELITIKINSSELSENPQISGLSCRKKNKTLSLKWPAERYNDNYGGYNVERSDDSIHFATINSAPVILLSSGSEKKTELSYKDSCRLDNRKYYYRVKGVNFFGELSDPSGIVSVYHQSDIAAPVIDSAWLGGGMVNLRWKADNKDSGAIRKYLLLRSEKDKGPYKKLFETSNMMSYSDTTALPSNYYKIAAITLNNDTVCSFSKSVFIPDSVPPSVPFLVSATAQKTGCVTIKWRRNNDRDLQGYNLFRKNSASNEFAQVNRKFITDTFFTDKISLATLSKKWFYCIAAADNSFNSSSFSNIAEAIIPDTIPPSAPVLNSAVAAKNGIKVKFIKSSSDDVYRHILMRRQDTQIPEDVAILENDDSSLVITDSTVAIGKTYSYQLKAADYSGNFSLSKPVTIYYETGFRKKIGRVDYNVDRREKHILLKWEYAEKETEKFIVYRGKENEPLTIVKTLNGNTLSWKDNTINIGNTYEYRIKAVMTSGAESIISDAIKVIY